MPMVSSSFLQVVSRVCSVEILCDISKISSA